MVVIADDNDDEIGAKVKLAKPDLTEREKSIPEITTGEDEDVLCSSSSIFSTNLLPFPDSRFRTKDEAIVAIVFFGLVLLLAPSGISHSVHRSK